MTSYPTCTIEECNNKLHFRGVCQRHYKELLGTDKLPRMNTKKTPGAVDKECSVDGCSTHQYAKELCRKHHSRVHRLGTTQLPKPKIEHGKVKTYRNGCRCEYCREAARIYNRAYRARRAATMDCGDPRKYMAGCTCEDCYFAWKESRQSYPHGTTMRYSSGCRCEDCTTGYSNYKATLWKTNDEYRYRGIARGANGRSTTTDITWEEVRDTLELYDHCLRCNGTESLSVDHVVPQSRGGKNEPINLQVLCKPCNSSKGKNIIDYRPDTDKASMKDMIGNRELFEEAV